MNTIRDWLPDRLFAVEGIDQVRYWALGFVVMSTLACHDTGPGKSIEFDVLRTAKRIEVRSADDQLVTTVTSPSLIRTALSFIERHRDGWREPWYGPNVPTLMLYFYEHDRKRGGFGVSRDALIVDPTMGVGWLSRHISKDELAPFLKQMGLTWPK